MNCKCQYCAFLERVRSWQAYNAKIEWLIIFMFTFFQLHEDERMLACSSYTEANLQTAGGRAGQSPAVYFRWGKRLDIFLTLLQHDIQFMQILVKPTYQTILIHFCSTSTCRPLLNSTPHLVRTLPALALQTMIQSLPMMPCPPTHACSVITTYVLG